MKNLNKKYGFEDHYRLEEYYDDKKILVYDTDIPTKIRQYGGTYIGYFTTDADYYVSEDGSKFDNVGDLLSKFDELNKSRLFNSDYYDPFYKDNYRMICGSRDYLKSLGFEMMDRHSMLNFDAYKYNDGSPIDDTTRVLMITFNEGSTAGEIKYKFENLIDVVTFNDEKSLIGGINSIIRSRFIPIMNNINKTLSSMNNDLRNDDILTLFVKDGKIDSVTERRQELIKILEEELRILKNQ